LNRNRIIIIIGIFYALLLGFAIIDFNWIFLVFALTPIFIYFCIENPFIFPFGIYALLLPFDSLMSITGEARGATLTKLLGILTILVFLLKGMFEKKLKLPDNAVILWSLLVVYGVLSVFWAIQPDLVLLKMPTAMGLLVLLSVTSSFMIKIKEFNTIKWCILAGGFIAAIYVIYEYFWGYFFRSTMRASIIYEERITDPNHFAFSLIIPFAISIEFILQQKNKIIKALFNIVLGIILFSIILTGSRGGLLSIVILCVVYAFNIRNRTTLWFLIIIFGIIVISYGKEIFIERIFESIETGGAGRVDIWNTALNSLKEYWTFGLGLNNFSNIFAKTPHNIYIGFFVEIGIVGLILLILAFIKYYQAIQSKSKNYYIDSIMLKAVFWAVLVGSFFLDTIWLKSFWLLLMMIGMYRNIMVRESIFLNCNNDISMKDLECSTDKNRVQTFL
jgi:O-antigen ligase